MVGGAHVVVYQFDLAMHLVREGSTSLWKLGVNVAFTTSLYEEKATCKDRYALTEDDFAQILNSSYK